MLDQQKITILYCRLSNEDALDGESNSIDVYKRQGHGTPLIGHGVLPEIQRQNRMVDDLVHLLPPVMFFYFHNSTQLKLCHVF